MLNLNSGLDAIALGQELQSARRLQIKDVLSSESADRVHALLAKDTPWWTAFNDGEKVAQVSPDMAARLGPEQVRELVAGIHRRAATRYQFFYNYYPLLGHYFDEGVEAIELFRVFEFLNSPEMISFFRTLTGRPDVNWVDAQATLFRAGHFLKRHTDDQPSEKRIAAYVLNLTRQWDPDWGGFLNFFDADYNVEQAFRPIFNALNIFLIPAPHNVGVVAPFATGSRLSITGWLRGDQPPGSFTRSAG